MHELEGIAVVFVALLAAGYLLAGAKGLDMSRLARYVISGILLAISLIQLMELM